MLARFLAAAAIVAAFGSPVVAAEPPKPTLVVQITPAGKLLSDVRDLVRLAAGPGQGETAVKAMQRELEDLLGEKGFEGLDLNRPAAAYAVVRDPFAESTGVVVVPITTEKEFLGLLERMKFKPVAVADKKGLYKLDLPAEILPRASHLRFADGWAYVCFNGDDVADPANLVPTAALIDPTETAQITARLHPERFPEKLLKAWLADFENTVGQVRGFLFGNIPPHINKGLGTLIDEGLKLLRRQAETLQAESQEVVLKYGFDTLLGTMRQELLVTPKPGSELAKAIAARKPTTNRFAGLVGKDAVVGLLGQPPQFSPEARNIAAALIEMLQGEIESGADVPAAFRPLAAEVLKPLAAEAKAGTVDLAGALNGPDKSGTFTLVGAVTLADGAAVEKAVRRAIENDALLKRAVKLDADKAGAVAIHTAAVGAFLPADWQAAFGKEAVLAVAFGPDAVYTALGPDAVAQVKAALALKPGPAAALDVVWNPARLTKLFTAVGNPEAAKQLGMFVKIEDKLVPIWTASIAGGEKLTFRVADGAMTLMKMRGGAAAGPPPPP